MASGKHPKFIYFDLGNVLLYFSHERMCRQMGEVLGADADRVKDFLFASNERQLRFEAGAQTNAEFHAEICEHFKVKADPEKLAHAASDIFTLNTQVQPILAHLVDAGYRLGILSNINDLHWQFICRRGYGTIPGLFKIHALSYRIGGLKPEPKIFVEAARMAGVAPEEIFYTDDIAGHIVGARAAGFDAVQFTGAAKLLDDLRERGIRINL
jgi:putative hydrolase of the HAD superfamily